MSWTLVFLIYTAHGDVHRNVLHGYASKGDCLVEARAFDRRFDFINWECVRDESALMAALKP
jgi:hypothetical protein